MEHELTYMHTHISRRTSNGWAKHQSTDREAYQKYTSQEWYICYAECDHTAYAHIIMETVELR